ncbi:DUF6541 family protein [Microbacterium gorillae]|uniref:DUF6541 family protein n=1 Tax=Microbacterium gorillae TaxID=1231063 RepID=UPI0006942344|nr:DUF6541 family protein [Microbacterium gorillae]
MAGWLTATPALIVATIVLFVPGLAILASSGVRGLRLWALAAPVSVALIGVTAIVLEPLGMRFTPLSAALATAIVAVIAFGARRLLVRRWPRRTFGEAASDPAPTRWGRVVMVLGLVLGASVMAVRLMRAFGSPEAVAQLFDNIFHLNAIAIIAATGHGSSLTIGNLTPASAGFYPAGFHDAAALVLASGLSDTPAALSATALVLCSVAWPLGLAYLGTRLFGTRPMVFVAVGVLAPGLTAFPYRMLSFGVLYSFLAALTLLPALWAVLLELFGTTRTPPLPILSAASLTAAVAVGVGLCHPSVIVATLLLAAPWAIARWIRALRDRTDVGIITALVAVYLVGTVVVFLKARPQLTAAPWDASQSWKQAARSVALLSPTTMTTSWALVGLLAVGAVAAVVTWRRSWPMLAAYVVMAGFYVAAATVPAGPIRDFLVGVWYRDTERLTALLMIAAVPLLIGGAVVVGDGVAALVRRLGREPVPLIAAAVVVTLLAIPVQLSGAREGASWVAVAFGQTGSTALLSPDERVVLARVAEIVPAGDVVVGDPITGASLTPAFSGRMALAPHVFGTRTPDEQYLLDHWDEAGTNPEVCRIIREKKAYWALEFGRKGVLGGTADRISGADALTPKPPVGITLVTRVGEAALFEATACR